MSRMRSFVTQAPNLLLTIITHSTSLSGKYCIYGVLVIVSAAVWLADFLNFYKLLPMVRVRVSPVGKILRGPTRFIAFLNGIFTAVW